MGYTAPYKILPKHFNKKHTFPSCHYRVKKKIKTIKQHFRFKMVSFLSNQFPWTHMAGFMKRHFYCSASSWADSSTQRNRSSDGELTAGGGLIRTHIHSSRNADYIFCREYKHHQELHCCQLPGIICYFETRRLLAVKVNGYKVFFFFFFSSKF